MTPEQIAEVLARFPEVRWDRWAGDLTSGVAYGWLDRTDGDRDFLVIQWEPVGFGFATSSAKWSAEVDRRLYGDNDEHSPCERIAGSIIDPNQ